MIIVVVLVVATLLARLVGALGVSFMDSWGISLRVGFALMLLLTASAHFGRKQADLARMVPPSFPKPVAIVAATGVLELLGAIGLLVPATSVAAAACLALLLVAMFPANVHAARAGAQIGGQPVTPLVPRAFMQVAFVFGLALLALRVI